MLTLVHRSHGTPEDVIELIEIADPGAPGQGQVRIRVTYVSIHLGDLLGIEGSPAFGDPPQIGEVGRTPGFEGVGVVEAIALDVDPTLGLKEGQCVAYFPVADGWSEWVVAPASSVVILPESVKLDVAAQALINTVTAETVIRAGHDAWPEDKREGVTVIQTGAASAVGRIITVLLTERGVSLIRLVRSRASARALEQDAYEGPVICTEDTGWLDRLRMATANLDVYVALDGVGGTVFSGLANVLNGGGTIVSYGSLGGASSDIRALVPRGLSVTGVSINQWFDLPDEVRHEDIQTAVRLAGTRPEMFPVEAIYSPLRIKDAVKHVEKPGRAGAILLDFRAKK